ACITDGWLSSDTVVPCMPDGLFLSVNRSSPVIQLSMLSVSRRIFPALLVQQSLHLRRQLGADARFFVFEINKNFAPVLFLFANKLGPALDVALRVIFAP